MISAEEKSAIAIDDFAAAFAKFTSKPAADSAFGLISCCQDFIWRQARGWHDPALSLSEKMREIMSEMLLILLEDFKPARVSHPNAVLSYLHSKIKRLTQPYRKGNPVLLENCDELAGGRSNFTFERLQLADEIFAILRQTLLGWPDQTTAHLEFLFVHIYPEIRWISRMLAQENGDDENQRIEADKKRHQKFNRSLRYALNSLQHGSYQEIMTWSGGERSHLAWRLINIAPAEISSECEIDRQLLADWREQIERRQPQPLQNLASARRVLSDMQKNHPEFKVATLAAEEAAPYGDEPEILHQLIGKPVELFAAAEDIATWEPSAKTVIDNDSKQLFAQVANEVSDWFNTLITSKNLANKRQSSYNFTNDRNQ